MRVAFGQFAFDSDRHCLERQGQVVGLTSKAFQLLEILLERHPKAVSKADLIDRLWPDVVVVAGNLANLVLEVRSTLGVSEGRRWIRTVRGFGYAFAGEVVRLDETTRPASSGFQLRLGERQFRLFSGLNSLGRSPDSIVPMVSRSVSRHHAQILVSDGKAVLHDLGSRNGTFLRGERIGSSAELHNGDSIVLGSELAGVLEVIPAPGSTASLGANGSSKINT